MDLCLLEGTDAAFYHLASHWLSACRVLQGHLVGIWPVRDECDGGLESVFDTLCKIFDVLKVQQSEERTLLHMLGSIAP